MNDLDPKRYIDRPVYVAHCSFIGGSHMNKNTASACDGSTEKVPLTIDLAVQNGFK